MTEVVHYTLEQLRAARDRALKKIKAQYEAERREILREYKVAMEVYGYAPAKKDEQ